MFLIDNHRDPASAEDIADPSVQRYETDRHVRRLDDGREYNVVKVMDEPDELALRLADAGGGAELHATPRFLYGSVRRD